MLYKQICIGRENRILDRISLKLMVFDYVEQTLQTERAINFLKKQSNQCRCGLQKIPIGAKKVQVFLGTQKKLLLPSQFPLPFVMTQIAKLFSPHENKLQSQSQHIFQILKKKDFVNLLCKSNFAFNQGFFQREENDFISFFFNFTSSNKSLCLIFQTPAAKKCMSFRRSKVN